MYSLITKWNDTGNWICRLKSIVLTAIGCDSAMPQGPYWLVETAGSFYLWVMLFHLEILQVSTLMKGVIVMDIMLRFFWLFSMHFCYLIWLGNGQFLWAWRWVLNPRLQLPHWWGSGTCTGWHLCYSCSYKSKMRLCVEAFKDLSNHDFIVFKSIQCPDEQMK